MTEIISSLTAREIEVIRLTTKGFKNCEIAKQLFISHKTVEVHKNNILKKLELKSTTELYCFVFKYLELFKLNDENFK